MKSISATLTLINENIRESRFTRTNNIEGRCPHCGYRFECEPSITEGKWLISCPNCNSARIKAERQSGIPFIGLLSFLSKSDDTYLPPFLPAFNFSISIRDYNEIIEDTNNLTGFIRQNYNRHMGEIISRIKQIGTQIFRSDREFQATLEYIFEEDYNSLIIFTNDSSIPWHWIYNNYSGEFLLDKMPCGTIYTERVDDSLRDFRQKKLWNAKRKDYAETVRDYFKDKKILFIFGKYKGDSNCQDLPSIASENKDLKNIISPPFNKENIIDLGQKLREGEIKDGQSMIRLLTSDEKERNRLKIIHFSGHVITKSFGNNSQQSTILDLGDWGGYLSEKQFLGEKYESEPLIFLNGCSSGEIFNIWDKSSNLATALLNKNASGCIVALDIVEDKSAHHLSKEFYKTLFKDPFRISYGKALLHVRKKLRKRNPDDPTRLLFHLFGDPNAKLCYIKPKSNKCIDLLRKSRMKKRKSNKDDKN